MKKLTLASLMIAQTCLAGGALAQQAPAALSVMLGGIGSDQPIAEKFTYCTPDGKGATKNGGNVNPSIHWAGAPAETKSYALIVVDPDVPASFESANKPGKTIPVDFPRQNFYHWVLVNIPAGMTSIAEGLDSSGITPGGKAPGKSAYGMSGQNDYAAKAHEGKGGGYDGPCPPWNDDRMHHYHFVVYALDVPSLALSGNFTGKQAEDAMTGHILAKGEAVGTFTTNQKLR